MFSRLQRVQFQQHKSYLHLSQRFLYAGARYQGYINYYHQDNLFGFVVREDAPEKEYYFHASDLHINGVPRVRTFQPVEFSISDSRDRQSAREISSIGGQALNYNHPNSRLDRSERYKKLSELPQGTQERHGGIVMVVNEEKESGLISPDRLNYNAVRFTFSELQTTGKISGIAKGAEVEFYARPQHKKPGVEYSHEPMDYAVCITRKGGGLITLERRDFGSRRRALGAMYNSQAIHANIPNEFSQNRKKGYVRFFDEHKGFGMITQFDDPSQSMFFHSDDCHMFGKRCIRRNQEVEYSIIQNEGKEKAMHVTGPNKTILKYISENHYVPHELCINTLDASVPNKIYTGRVVRQSDKNPNVYIIRPDKKNTKNVITLRGFIKAVGRKHLFPQDYVQFNVQPQDPTIEKDKDTDKEFQTQLAINVCAGGNKPIVIERGEYGIYLSGRINLNPDQLEECPLSNKELKGFISGFNSINKAGTIEIEAPKNKRYRKISFSINDLILPNNVDENNIRIRNGEPVQFKIAKDETPKEGSTLTQKALNIKSINSEHINLWTPKHTEELHDEHEEETGSHDTNVKNIQVTQEDYEEPQTQTKQQSNINPTRMPSSTSQTKPPRQDNRKQETTKQY